MDTSLQGYLKAQTFTVWMTYMLYALLVTSVIGFVISIIKIQEYKRIAAGNDTQHAEAIAVFAEHQHWLNRTFVGIVIFAMVSMAWAGYGVGIGVAAIGVVWWVYRIVRGVLALTRHQGLYDAGTGAAEHPLATR